MCTLSALPLEHGGFRLAFNRDESRRRPAGLAPERMCAGPRAVVRPIDPQAGGTWIGVNDAGLAAALLNVHAGPRGAGPAAGPSASRGEIVPLLLARDNLQAARQTALDLDARRYPPFRVFLCQAGRCVDVISDGASIRAGAALPLDAPLMRTSSGLGDGHVEKPRRDLFERLLERHDPIEAQILYHRHAWPARPHLSVCMRRAEAATVSHSLVEVDPRARLALFVYHPAPPDEEAFRHVSLMELRG
jgi:uncharacterized protein with NRDE domain